MIRQALLSGVEHVAIRDLLPFFVNGTLSEHETARVTRHASHCPDCANEIERQRQLATGLRALPVPAGDAGHAWRRVEEKLAAGVAPGGAPRERVKNLRTWTLAACTLLGVAALLVVSFRAAMPAYRTVTSQPPHPVVQPGSFRVVFAPHATLREIEALLADTYLYIVSGPSRQGVYILSPVAPVREDSLAALRSSPLVAFAEPVWIGAPSAESFSGGR